MSKPLWERLTFSALERYVKICETVFNSDAFLSQGNRMDLIQELLERDGNPTVEQIEAACKELEQVSMEVNMARAKRLQEGGL